jgi:hypothetical protein
MKNKFSLYLMVMLFMGIVLTAFNLQIKLNATIVKFEEIKKLCRLKESIIQTMLSPPDVLPIDIVWADGVERPILVKHLPARLLRK